MTIHQILQRVSTFPKEDIILFREGSFRKCYNQHAFYFTQNIKEMKVHTRFYKNAQTYVHSMGFPETALQKYITLLQERFGGKVVETTDIYVRISGIVWGKVMNYQIWKENLIREEEKKEAHREIANRGKELLPNGEGAEPIPKAYWELAERIKNYKIECATPLEAFNFLQKLKRIADECAPTKSV